MSNWNTIIVASQQISRLTSIPETDDQHEHALEHNCQTILQQTKTLKRCPGSNQLPLHLVTRLRAQVSLFHLPARIKLLDSEDSSTAIVHFCPDRAREKQTRQGTSSGFIPALSRLPQWTI